MARFERRDADTLDVTLAQVVDIDRQNRLVDSNQRHGLQVGRADGARQVELGAELDILLAAACKHAQSAQYAKAPRAEPHRTLPAGGNTCASIAPGAALALAACVPRTTPATAPPVTTTPMMVQVNQCLYHGL